MKKKHLKLTELSISSFTTEEGRQLRGGLEKIAVDGSAVNCDTDCIGRYCDPA